MPEELFSSLIRFLQHTNQTYNLLYVKYIREFGGQLANLGTPNHFKTFVSETLAETFDRTMRPIVTDEELEQGKI